jgi:hypothetical protein
MLDALPPITLRSGVRIANTVEHALEFIKNDSSYQHYDQVQVAHDDVLTEADVRVANAMIARMSPGVIAGIVARAPSINAALRAIPPEASLTTAENEIPWDALARLMEAIHGIPQVKLARQTKVLHKKRPALIPILDSVVTTYLRRVDRLVRTADAAPDAVELMRSYKRELDANLPAITALQGELSARGIHLTECRLLDLFLWAYSGTYTPLYLRAEAETDVVSGRSAAVASIRSRDSSPGIEVEVFRDDDVGYLAWLTAHPRGFVVNAARNPRPNYLILHRASCSTIRGRPTRGGSWTGPYVKVCSDDKLVIAAWTGMTVGAAPTRCGVCLR